jgi:cyclopropane fatty-acyl-phospholipid synthase-like methyltransferase
MKTIYKEWHQTFPNSGQGKQYPWLLELVQSYKPKTMLDWGCGKGGTIQWLNQLYPDIKIQGYDPGNPDYQELPQGRFDMVYSCDVLEHVEIMDIPDTIAEIKKYSKRSAHIIDLTPAKKILPDGRNAHVTLMSADDWQQKLDQYAEAELIRIYHEPDKRFHHRSRVCIVLKH